MDFELNDAINNFVSAYGKVFLNACPGSGKTTAVAYKLSKLVAEWEFNHHPYAGIACLSFTNVAKEEISQKYREFHQVPLKYPHLVSTIDSFINLNITLPHYHLLGKSCKRPIILDDDAYLDDWKGKWNKKFTLKDKKYICFAYPPRTIEFEIDGSYSFGGIKPKDEKVDISKFNSYSVELKNWQLDVGLLKTTDSAFVALDLLRKYPRIGEYIARRFPVIIVDEAQDTSEIQLAILNILAD